ncbi:MAG: 30S ribosome-binding factor RbfA [Gemmatimonadaceae bacterium]|nr:30S ribosome-binding factor RbfA [Gemmatimonadaceae bacterium]
MAGNERRPDRVAAAIREEVARVLSRDVQDPRITGAFVTVTGCEVSRDLRTAKVFVSILGDEETKALARDGLTDLAPQLRGPIGRALRLRAAPEIFFKVDQSVAYAARIETLLAQIKTPAVDGDSPDPSAETTGAGDDDDRSN